MQPITVERFIQGDVFGSRFEYEPGILVCVMTTDAAKKDAVYRAGSELAAHRLRVHILTNRNDELEIDRDAWRSRYEEIADVENSIPTPRVTPIPADRWPQT